MFSHGIAGFDHAFSGTRLMSEHKVLVTPHF